MTRDAYVHEADIALHPEVDPRAVGGAVTVALCGHWEHEGPCCWPHNNEISELQNSECRLQIGKAGLQSDDPGSATLTRRFRTLFICDLDDEPIVREKIRAALHSSSDWRVVMDRSRAVAPDERELADDLLLVPRRVTP